MDDDDLTTALSALHLGCQSRGPQAKVTARSQQMIYTTKPPISQGRRLQCLWKDKIAHGAPYMQVQGLPLKYVHPCPEDCALSYTVKRNGDVLVYDGRPDRLGEDGLLGLCVLVHPCLPYYST